MISEFLFNKVNGYKIIHRLTNEERDMFDKLYFDWKIWISGLSDPMEDDEIKSTFQSIADFREIPLKEYNKKIHIKYGTDGKSHGIFEGYIVKIK